jgi:hypothetical protein
VTVIPRSKRFTRADSRSALVVAGPGGVVRWSYEAPPPGDLLGFELLREGVRSAAPASP